MLTVEHTIRGFAIAKGVDRYGVPFSIQDSSLAEEPCIWFGCAASGSDRAHLTQDHVRALLPLLTRFVDTGSIDNANG